MIISPEGSKITILYGEAKVVFKLPVIIERRIKRLYWFGYRKEYWIEWEYCKQGPFKRYSEAQEMHTLAMAAYNV